MAVTTPESTFSQLGLGTVQFGMDYGINNSEGQVTVESATAIVARAVRGGVTFIDTARAYGESEQTVAQAVDGANCRDAVTISTKLILPPECPEAELRAGAAASVNESLSQLGADRLEILMLHRPPYRTAGNGVVWDYLKEKRDEGLIGRLGVSVAQGPAEGLDCIADAAVEVVQIPFNCWDSRWNEFLDEARERDIVVVNRSTYLQGLLIMAPEQVGQRLPRAVEWSRRWHELSDRVGVPPKELAFRYVVGESRINTTLVGVDCLAQLEENLDLLALGPLAPDVQGEVAETMAGVPETIVNPGLWED